MVRWADAVISKVISQIRVTYEERQMGKLRVSRLVRVGMIPAAGQPQSNPIPGEESPEDAAEGKGKPADLRRCRTIFEDDPAAFRDEDSRGPG